MSLATNGKQAMDLKKRAGVADINPDALPSSVASKVVTCLDKRHKALTVLKDAYQDIPQNKPDHRDHQKEKESDHARSLVWSSACASNPTLPTVGDSVPKDAAEVALRVQEARAAVCGNQP